MREIYGRMEEAINARGPDWTPWLRAGYLGFARPGGYFCAGVGIYRQRPIEFWIRLPLPPDELGQLHGFANPYPQLEDSWHGGTKEWHWSVPAVEAVPDLGPAIELTARYQPQSGSMPTPDRLRR